MTQTLLLREIDTRSGRRFGHATLNAPATLNALTLDMIDGLAPRFAQWAADPGIVGVVLDAAGDKAFSAGGDVQALRRAVLDGVPGEVPAAVAGFFEREYRLDHRIHTFAKPVLCWGHGIVMGGGVGLLAGASHRVVTPRSRVAMPEISIGLYPDVGGSWFLNRMPGKIGLFLALTGAPLNAADACFAGLADVVIAHDAKARVFDALAATDWTGSSEHDAAQLSRVLAASAWPAAPDTSPLRRHLDLIATVIGHDTLADTDRRLRALQSHEDPWLAAAAATYAAGSPSSAALSHAVLKRAEHLTLADVFRLEYDLSIACCLQADFSEGVRAVLVDKDRAPRWQPATLAEVMPALIATHFAPQHTGAHPLADLRD
jgi:enoyl-CoA hydratase/carnithine racemase